MNMKNNRKENAARNIYWGIINRIVSIIFPFFIRTVIIKTIGSEYLGLGSLFSSILQVLSLSELGISSAIVYSMYRPVAEGDNKTICALLTFYKKIYRKIGTFIFVVGLCLLPFLDFLIDKKSTVDINIYILYILYLTNASISYFLFAYKSAILTALQRNDIESKLVGTINIIMYLVQIVMLIFTKNYYCYYIITPISSIVLNIARSIYVDKKYPEYITEEKLDESFKSKIWNNVKSLIVYKIGGIVSNSVDNIIISAFLGLTVLAIYNNYYYIISALFSVLTVYYESIKAGIGNSLVTDSVKKNEETFNTLMLLQSWIVGWCSICLFCLFQPFMMLWVGKSLTLKMSHVLLLSVYFYVWKIQDIVHTYKEALGFWEKDKFRPIVSSLLNLTLNLMSVKFWGLYGIILSTILSELLINLPWAPRVLYKYYFKKKAGGFYIRLLKYTGITLVAGYCTYALCSLSCANNGWGELTAKMVICASIPNMIYIALFCRQKEFSKIMTWIKSLLKNRLT